MSQWNDILRGNFAVILLSLLFACMMTLIVHVSHHGIDKDLLGFMEHAADGILGAILLCLKTPSSKALDPPTSSLTIESHEAKDPK